MPTIKRLLVFLFLSFTLLAPTGCAAFAAAAGKILVAAAEAGSILDSIAAVVDVFLARNPQPWGDEYARIMSKTRIALAAAIKATEGGKKLSEDETDAAFADFREAYGELTKLLEREGMLKNGNLMRAPGPDAPPVIDVPEPMALSLKAK